MRRRMPTSGICAFTGRSKRSHSGGNCKTGITAWHRCRYCGICRGCALSPLIGGSLLHHVDNFFNAQEGLWYARYMDDFLLFTRTRWQLRRSVKRLHEFFDPGGFETHPDKTQLGNMGTKDAGE